MIPGVERRLARRYSEDYRGGVREKSGDERKSEGHENGVTRNVGGVEKHGVKMREKNRGSDDGGKENDREKCDGGEKWNDGGSDRVRKSDDVNVKHCVKMRGKSRETDCVGRFCCQVGGF